MTQKTTVLILGASGMLGHKMFEALSSYSQYKVYGTVTSLKSFNGTLPEKYKSSISEAVYANDLTSVEKVLTSVKPNVVINCIGMIKQKKENGTNIQTILLNALFPQQVSSICEKKKIRFITIATDCVFDGKKESEYFETDLPTCHDVYGMTKFLGEIHSGTSLTLRTSIIGHELKAGVSLLDWFLGQSNKTIKGYNKAIFTGFPTVVLARIIAEKVIPNKTLRGLYHLSANSISKYDLLKIIKKEYKMKVKIFSDSNLKINRALNSDKIRNKIRYSPPPWNELIREMHMDYLSSPFYKSRHKNEK
ncbi:MAG: SDR family oxidoreductase [Microgenomates group bacterium]